MENAEMEEFINTVRERSDIYNVVSRYVPLTLKNGRFWACCPFHDEKTPSFSVSPDKGIFYCFGCHEGGNVFKFISKIENITYFEAVKLQAERLGIKIPSRKKTSAEIQVEQEKDSLQKITLIAQNFYHNILTKSKEGEQGRKYLAARGISEKVITDFQIGFAPDSWDSLTKKITAQGYSEKQIVSAGLAVEKRNGGGVYDRLRGRVVIPICDILGKPVAFGGRILEAEENQPKYLNTPETEIFSKGKLLFALNKSSRAIISANEAIIVEGYMDAISLYSAGFENVVATLGTAFTEEQAKLLSRYARKIIFCYDSDEAGQRATVRALPIMKHTGAEVFVLIIPEGKDPDEFVRKHGKDAFARLLKNVTPIINYLFNYKLNHIDYSTFSGKLQVLNEMFPICFELNNPALQKDYLRKFSSLLILDEEIIFEEWRKFLSRSPTKNKTLKPIISKTSLISQAGKSIIQKLWYEPEYLDYVNSLAPKEIFTDVHKEIISFIEKCHAEGKMPDDLTAEKELSAAANNEVTKIICMLEPPDSQILAFQDSVKIMRRIGLERLLKQTLLEAKEFYKSGDSKNFTEKMQTSIKVQNELDNL